MLYYTYIAKVSYVYISSLGLKPELELLVFCAATPASTMSYSEYLIVSAEAWNTPSDMY